MQAKIGSVKALLLEGTLNNHNLEAIVNKANDLFSDSNGLMQCCSLELVPSMNYARQALENTLAGKAIPSAKIKKPALNFLLWIYCVDQLEKAIKFAGQGDKFLLVIAAEEDAALKKSLKAAKDLGFVEKDGLIEENLKENKEKLMEHFDISKDALKAFSHLPESEAIEKLAMEKQALLGL